MRFTARVRMLMTLTLATGMGACASTPRPGAMDVTRDYAPPSSWRSGVDFLLGDRVPGASYTTRVEFRSGGETRVVTGRDLFDAPTGEVRTPWYRLEPASEPLVLRFTVEHPGGARTVAEYPLPVERGVFYSVSASVYTRRPAPSHYPDRDYTPVAYPLNPAAAAQPGDSLWISYFRIGRVCFTVVCH